MRRSAALVGALLCAAWLITATATVAAAAGCAALDYEASLTTARNALAASPPDVAGAARTISAALASDASAGGALQPVVADLSAQPPDVVDAGQRLDSITSALAYPPGSTCHEDLGTARNALHDVYAAPAFRHLDDVQQSSLLTTVLNFLGGLVSHVGGALGQFGALLVVLAVVTVVAVVAARRGRAAARTRARSFVDEPPPGDDPDLEWRAAAAAAAAGNFREATRRAFRSSLLDVAARDKVIVDPAWTTRELLERCNADGDVLLALAGAAALFDRAWYSGGAVTRADWDLAADRCAALRRLARGRRVPVA